MRSDNSYVIGHREIGRWIISACLFPLSNLKSSNAITKHHSSTSFIPAICLIGQLTIHNDNWISPFLFLPQTAVALCFDTNFETNCNSLLEHTWIAQNPFNLSQCALSPGKFLNYLFLPFQCLQVEQKENPNAIICTEIVDLANSKNGLTNHANGYTENRRLTIMAEMWVSANL